MALAIDNGNVGCNNEIVQCRREITASEKPETNSMEAWVCSQASSDAYKHHSAGYGISGNSGIALTVGSFDASAPTLVQRTESAADVVAEFGKILASNNNRTINNTQHCIENYGTNEVGGTKRFKNDDIQKPFKRDYRGSKDHVVPDHTADDENVARLTEDCVFCGNADVNTLLCSRCFDSQFDLLATSIESSSPKLTAWTDESRKSPSPGLVPTSPLATDILFTDDDNITGSGISELIDLEAFWKLNGTNSPKNISKAESTTVGNGTSSLPNEQMLPLIPWT